MISRQPIWHHLELTQAVLQREEEFRSKEVAGSAEILLR